ncbi:hypothetical protein PG994_002584 [Apiospora phragmitis]|uniref:Carboxy-cis,cis-muconate cyclase n=1 Tax=Apiospora phragmitis TaxID=2905665 RepID=A0ABR1W5S1_9PEZI
MTTTVHARVHHLFVGNLNAPARLYALAFDDETLGFEVTANMMADATHAWIAFDANKTNVYGASLGKAAIASYEVVVEGGQEDTTKNLTLAFRNSVAAAGECFNRTAAFVLPHPVFPRVYTGSWPGPEACAMALSISEPPPPGNNNNNTTNNGGGVLEEVIQSWRYGNTSGIHGLALDPAGTTIYSADLNGDALWAHVISPDGTGRVVGLRGRYDLAPAGQHPRHLVVHPNGRVLYVVMEAASVVAAYSLDDVTRLPVAELSRHSLLPEGAEPGEYWSAEVMLSFVQRPDTQSPKYLWATARAWPGNGHTGFISAFGLDGESGQVREQLFRVPTTTKNGIANAVAPAPWSEDWAAMTDVGTGYVQMWHIEPATSNEETGEVMTTTARDVARVDIPDGGCCANVIWYD